MLRKSIALLLLVSMLLVVASCAPARRLRRSRPQKLKPARQPDR